MDPVLAGLLARSEPAPEGEVSTADAIMAAAEQLFLDHGYHATHVSEVARIAEVSIGSIYVHYESKEGLFSALVERALDTEARYLDAVLESDVLPDFEKVVALGEAYLQFWRDHPGYFRLLMLPVETIPDEAAGSPLVRQVAQRGNAQRRRLAEVITNCVEQGIMRPDVDAVRVANFWWAAWNGVVALTMRDDELAIDDRELEQVIIEGRLMIAEGLASATLRGAEGRLVDFARERLLTMQPAPSPSAPDLA